MSGIHKKDLTQNSQCSKEEFSVLIIPIDFTKEHMCQKKILELDGERGG